eukprot:m.545378 g.545378  ORF g.545378 m.545378 type:complete len:174 (-) comp22146_c0_seq4:46-567(-)
MDARMRNTAVHQSSASNMMMPTQAMMMPMMNRRTSETMDAYDPTIEDSIDLSQSDSESVDDDEFAVGGADVATTVVKTGGAGASTFTIDRTANIAADNKEHKVTIAILSTLNPTYRHFATPDVEEKVPGVCLPLLAVPDNAVAEPASVVLVLSCSNIYTTRYHTYIHNIILNV